MSGSVVPSSSGNGLSRVGNISVGESASSDGLTFSSRAEMYEDLPTHFRVGASKSNAVMLAKEASSRQGGTDVVLASSQDILPPVDLPPTVAEGAIASGVRKLSKNFKNDDRIVQRKIGWFATPTYIYVTTVERELKWRPDKKLEPVNKWAIENRRKWSPTQGVADKRVGNVEINSSEEGVFDKPQDHYVEEAESIPDAFVDGADAMAYLPRVVRGDIVRQTPRPTYFDGRLLGIANAETGDVDRHEVSLLRMNDELALVVHATRLIAGNVWEVTQARYDLTTPKIESA